MDRITDACFSSTATPYTGTSLFTAAIKRSALNGLMIQPFAPAFFARSMSAGCPSEVSITTGTVLVRGSAFIFSTITKPFILGMLISHMTRETPAVATLPTGRDRNRHELTLQMAIGVPIAAARGWASAEYEETYRSTGTDPLDSAGPGGS